MKIKIALAFVFLFLLAGCDRTGGWLFMSLFIIHSDNEISNMNKRLEYLKGEEAGLDFCREELLSVLVGKEKK